MTFKVTLRKKEIVVLIVMQILTFLSLFSLDRIVWQILLRIIFYEIFGKCNKLLHVVK